MHTNREKRDLVFSMLLGDGCLSYIINKKYNKVYTGSFIICHSDRQRDYLEWKAALLNSAFAKDSRVVNHPQSRKSFSAGRINRFAITEKRFKIWRKWTYPSHRKSIARILPWITNKALAVAIWFMDDGASSKYTNYLHIESCTPQEVNYILEWFKNHFSILPVIVTDTNSGKPYLRFTGNNGRKIWEIIRATVNQIPSMKNKFKKFSSQYDRMQQPRLHGHNQFV